MSKINAVRLINVNYNNNAIRISDECFHFNGESTLISLRNGGGKSVLVQMMTAPFVHKRYRDAKDRPFESYFTTNKPSFIMVEWVLDQGAGYVLTGMMVRRTQDTSEGNSENLDMVNFITEYQEPCVQDIHHIPVVEKTKKEMVLKNFSACRQMFEAYKKDRSMKFFCYDMTNSAQSRQYFDKLMEYQINYKEWETIIKKVNLKESGLSDLFADCKDEKGLVEKWFLEAVESKLNKERNRIREFGSILEKYAGQYKDNRSKIKRRDTIRAFKEEAQNIQEKAQAFWSAGEEVLSQENRIACFLKELNALHEEVSAHCQEISDRIEMLQKEISRVEYEELSSQIYELNDRQRFHTGNRDMIEFEKENLEREREKIEEQLHLLVCAKQQEGVKEEQSELEMIRQKLLISRKKEEDLEPERKRLGYALKCYYRAKKEEISKEQEENQSRLQDILSEIKKEKEKTDRLEEKIREVIAAIGGLSSQVKAYAGQEEQFNSRYGQELVRNILGVYEPGTLEIKEETYQKQLLETTRGRTQMQKNLEASRESARGMERSIEDLREQRIRGELRRKQLEEQQAAYEEELNARRIVLKYLNLEERQLFDREKILLTSTRKLEELSALRRNLEKEEDILTKEYQRLSSGKILELPKEIEEELNNLGIHAVYGMEWLKKNGYTEKENQSLVHRHPFLPYSLLMSGQELEKLAQNANAVYTSFPIPIMVREELEGKETEDAKSVVCLEGVSFYVLFNEKLLNEDRLRQMLEEKKRRIIRVQEAVAIRQKEYEEYFTRHKMVENQSVTKENYEEGQGKIRSQEEELDRINKALRDSSQSLLQLKNDMEELQTSILKTSQEIQEQKQRIEDFARLCTAYRDYENNRELLEKARKEENRFKENQRLSRERQEKLHDKEKTLETQRGMLEREGEEAKDRYRQYEQYDKVPVEDLDITEKGKEMLEARYAAITSGLSMELKELEKQEQKAIKRFREAQEELEYLRKKYSLKDNAWKNVRYNRKEEAHQEILLEDRRSKIETKKMLWNEEDKQIALLNQEISGVLKRISMVCGEDKPLPKEQIQNQDFQARKNQLLFQEKEAKKDGEAHKKRLQSYDENLTALSEYSAFLVKQEVEWEQDFREMNNHELRNFKGILIRDYNQKKDARRQRKDSLVQVLNRVVRLEAFQEDFYRKPLEAMLELCDDAARVLAQLHTTVQSYDSLMEKLEVDISLVEKEKERIVELMEDYIMEIHNNLGKIDRNSTITVRGRSIKMLKLELPVWEENQNLYHIRLEDFIDEVTKKGVSIFEKNENAQEYFGTQVTTKKLYDKVIGIGNVQIRLYKIEAEREYPITWAEVAKNSGGEGFLSAFVILSSLLYYMRKDDTDIFAQYNEGKVLVMDNPFAQTNAAHLLKPLMEVAKKSNTQLICLTGLGGESIYNRFDNIYVLNLIAASLRNGMQYVRAEHLRGNEPERMIASHIQVYDQQELLF